MGFLTFIKTSAIALLLLGGAMLTHAESVTVSANVIGSGVVLGTGVAESGSQITLRAAPEVDWKFDHWEGVPTGLAQTNPMTLTASASLHPIAVLLPSSGSGRFGGGSVISWGGVGPAPAGLDNVVAVSVGAVHALALRADGTVAVWGANNVGQTNMPAGLSNVVAITAGGYHSVALKQSGELVAWGQNVFGQTNVPTGLSNVVALAGGVFHTLALRADGTVAAWGNTNFGQCAVPASLRDVVAIAAGQYYSLALKQDGKLVGWGAKYSGTDWTTVQVQTNLTNLVAIASCYNYDLGIQSDGTVLEWGSINDVINTPIPIGLKARSVATGFDHGLAILTNRTLISWGNRYSQLPQPINDALVADAGADSTAVIRGNGFGIVGGKLPTIFQEEGQSFRLLPSVIGGTYQWLRNGQPIAGAISAAFAVVAATNTDSGSYQLAVSNGAETFVTQPTDVRILPPGYPRVLVNGSEVRDLTRVSGQARITLTSTLTNAQIYYTLDGSTPTTLSNRYTAAFTLVESTNVTLRALAVSGDLTRQATNAPVQIAVVPSYTLSVILTGPGHVDVTPKAARYFQGDVVRLEAVPDPRAHFVRWANQLAGPNPVREITMNFNWTVEAVFEDEARFAPTIIADGGTVTLNPAGPQYAGTDVSVSASAKPGFAFAGWSGDHIGSDPNFIWHVAGPATFKANFDTAITAIANGPGRIVLEPNLPRYPFGTQVKVTPAADYGNYFVQWGSSAAGQPATEFTLTVTNGPTQISGVFGPLSTPAYRISEARVESGQFKFRVTGTVGTTASIESTIDFNSWTNEGAVTLQGAGGIEQAIPIGGNRRFVRTQQTQ